MSRVKFDTSSIPDWATLTDWARLEILQNTVSELYEDRDAQRLRADTAEANFNRCNGLYYEFQKDRDTLRSDLAAAEQRIAEMRELLVEVQKAARKQAWAHGYPTLFAAVDAALNQKSEGESQRTIDALKDAGFLGSKL